MKIVYALLGLGLTLLASSCLRVEELGFDLFNTSPRERYERALLGSDLRSSALLARWQAAGEQALRDSTYVTTPFYEKGYFAAASPEAIGYRFRLALGDALRVQLRREPGSATVFGDLLRITATDTGETFKAVAYWDTTTYTFEYELRSAGDYLLRIQPELLVSCRYELSVTQYPPLNFPVQGKGNRAIGSFWGDERDNGARSHEGVDIFASKGTPVLAITDGLVTRTGDGGLGGKTVWVSDPLRGVNLYYAHLDSQYVAGGERVRVGDTLGTVGNTGNARYTPSHLHFGIYYRGRGAIDPLPFIYQHSQELPRLTADTSLIGNMVRTNARTVALETAPGGRHQLTLARLPQHTALQVQGAAGTYLRVRTPRGRAGYVSAKAVRPADAPIDRITVAAATEVRQAPSATAAPIALVAAGERLPVYARTDGYAYVELSDGDRAWLAWP